MFQMDANEHYPYVEIASLSNNPQFPCTHIVFQHIPILLDASLELQFQRNVEQSQGGASMVSSGFASSLPLRMIMPGVSAIALEDVECLLISNCYNMLALPYITEYTQFRGKIYATGPTVEFGRLMMEELVHNFAINRQTGEPAYIVECDNEVRHLYSINDIERCMSKVNILRYDEFRDLRDGVCIVPRSSGFSLGAANWVIESPSGKVSYLAASSNSEFGHSRIIDTSPLSDVDAIITTQVCKPLEVPLWESLKVALDMIARSIQHHGNILIPVHPCGNMFELISIISQDLKARGFTETPMHVVSPVAKRSLQFANIQGEWMSKDRQMHIYEARHPLILNDLLEERLLHHHEHADSIFSYRGPYIVFVGHPSLIAGEFSKLFRRWKRDPRNLLVMTEVLNTPAVPGSFFSNSKMQVCLCPLETRLSLDVIAQRLSGRVLIAPSASATPVMPPRTLQKGTSFIDLTPFAFTRVQFERNQTQGLIPQEFLATVERQRANPSDPLDVRISGVAVADVDGVVVLPHVPRTVTLPAMNTGNLAPDMLVKRCRHQLGPGTAAINKSGFVLDWNGGADRLAVEEGLVRIQTESMAVMRLLQAILREPPVSGD